MRTRSIVAVLAAATLLAGAYVYLDLGATGPATAPLTPLVPSADIEKYPGLGSLEMRSGTGWGHWCGIVLVCPAAAVTVAHCVTLDDHRDRQPELFRGRFGSAVREAGGVVAAVAEIRPHPTFVYGGDGVDLAVVILAEPVPVAATTILAPDPSAPVDLLGWGGLKRGAPFSATLEHVPGRILAADRCAQVSIQPWEICTASLAETGPCGGDSGTPGSQRLPGGADTWGTVGLLSRGFPGLQCGAAPDVYLAVHDHLEWILQQTTPPPARQHPAVVSVAVVPMARDACVDGFR